MPEAATLRVLVAGGADRLRESGIAEPRREAIRIWSEVAGGSPADVALGGSEPADSVAAALFEQSVARRSRGEPLAHVVGRSGFRRLTLVSDGRALIPRPETEGLVDLVLKRIHRGRVLDVGTGSGCIALSLAQEGRFSEVVGVDASAQALDLARLNRDILGVPVTLVRGDLCLPFREGAFDALISNPPYLTSAEYMALDLSVRQWEPAAALVGGDDGMVPTRRLLDEGRKVLRPGGWLALELDCSRAISAARHARGLGWHDVAIHVDLFGRERYLLAQRSNER
ncbi:MAG TPA: peptide chain release factor N(5)-glutamine methyltransferase [Gemmatimonadales bacterium]|nr:peptide chain release factor N(5)-glutamine methyltransferase [Gemmatimonadales bacterium]